jgi:phosphoserine phosphatase
MAPRFRLVTFDIDGTLTTVHGWRWLADRVGRRPDYEETQARFHRREIGEDEHLSNLLRLADGLTVNEVEAILESTPRIDGIAEAVGAWHARRTRVALLSHNPDYVCAWYARTFGFDGFAGTTLPSPVDGRLYLPAPVRANKLEGLAELLRLWGLRPGEVAHVGDGWADAALFPRVAAGVALNSRFPEVEAAADLVVRAGTLRDLPYQLERLVPRPRPPDQL